MSEFWIHCSPEVGYMKQVVPHLINQKYISDEVKNRLNFGIACYHSLQNLFCVCVCGHACMHVGGGVTPAHTNAHNGFTYTAAVIVSSNMITYVLCHTNFCGKIWLHYKIVLHHSLV
jgi:hypothetical protein